MSGAPFVLTAEADRATAVAMAAAAKAVSGALRAGTRVPGFELPDSRGNRISLDQLLAAGPVVLSFMRGAWCAFGEESLERLATTHARIVEAGAVAMAIAPPRPLPSPGQALAIPELVDVDMMVARSFGLAFELPAELRQRYLQLGYVPPRTRDPQSFLVPIPATYLVDQKGVVVLAHIDADYRHHLDHATLLGALHSVRARAAGRERTVSLLAGRWRPGRNH